MKKRLLIPVLLLLNTCLMAQQFTPNELGNYTYQEVVKVAPPTAEALATPLFEAGFRDISTEQGNNVIASGKFSTTAMSVLIQVHYNLLVELKDGRYRFTVSNIQFENVAGSLQDFDGAPAKHQRRWLDKLNEELPEIVRKVKYSVEGGQDEW